MDVVVEVVDVVDVEEDEGFRMARSMELIFGILLRLSLLLPLKTASSFHAQIGVSFSITSASWYTDCDF